MHFACKHPELFAYVLCDRGAVTCRDSQALPTLELMRALTRSTLGLQEAGFLSLPWRYTIGYLLADWGGFHEWMTYLGLVPVGLGLLALFKSRAPARWFWLGLTALSLLYALGVNTPIYPLLYRLVPVLGWVRVPSRALLLVALSTSVLAAYGADALLIEVRTSRARYLANMTRERWEKAVAEHEDILAALEARNGTELGRILKAHLSNKLETVAAWLQANG